MMNSININLENIQLYRKGLAKVSFEVLIDIIEKVNFLVRDKKVRRVSIGVQDTLLFLGAFLSCSFLKKEIVLLPNFQQGTIEKHNQFFDIYLNDEKIKSTINKLSTDDFKLDLNNKIVFFTSGSTGDHKKVSKRFIHLYKEIEVLDNEFSGTIYKSIIISTVSHQHIYGLIFRLLWPILKGIKVVLENINYPEELYKLKEEKYTLISSPAFIKRLIRNNEEKILTIGTTFSSGGELVYEFADKIKSLTDNFPIEVYGSTETGGIAYRKQNSNNLIWTPFSNVRILKSNLECIRVKSNYFDEPYIDTNDLFENKDEGFKLIGRSNRFLKIEEKRIFLPELEKFLLNLNEVVDVYCLKINKKNRDQIACILKINENSDFFKFDTLKKTSWLKSLIRNEFDPILVPKLFRYVDELPYNSQSKIDLKMAMEYFS